VVIEDDLYLITGTHPFLKCWFTIGTDGEKVFTLGTLTPDGQIQGAYIGDAAEGCPELGQILWAAFGSQKYWGQNTNHDIISLENFPANQINPGDTQVRIPEFLPNSKLPATIEFIGPNYLGSPDGTNKMMLSPPYDHGYLIGRYHVNKEETVAGVTLPIQFEYKQMYILPSPKDMYDVHIGVDNQFTVTSFDTNSSQSGFLPAMTAPRVVVTDRRIPEASETRIYTILDKKWLAKNGPEFKENARMIKLYKEDEDRQTSRNLYRVLIIAGMAVLILAPLAWWALYKFKLKGK
jgi:hypothetical protein